MKLSTLGQKPNTHRNKAWGGRPGETTDGRKWVFKRGLQTNNKKLINMFKEIKMFKEIIFFLS